MPYYGVLFDTFWTGPTGREIARTGGKDAQLLGAYLTANRFANMLGLYRIGLDDMRSDIGTLSRASVIKALEHLAAVDFAAFDDRTEIVWVRSMARFRLNLTDERPKLERSDKRVLAVNRLYAALPDNPHLAPFFDLYHTQLHLSKRRDPGSLKPLGRGIEGASKGLIRAIEAPSPQQDQGSEISDQRSGDQNAGIRDQGSGSEKSTGFAGMRELTAGIERPDPNPNAAAEENYRVILRITHEVFQSVGAVEPEGDLLEAIKWACAKAKVTYNGRVVQKAYDAAKVQRAKKETA